MQASPMGTVTATLVGRRADSLETDRLARIELTFEGVVGDKHAGFLRRADSRVPHYKRGTQIRNDRQLTLVSEEDLAAVADALGLPRLEPEWMGANVCVRGVPEFTRLPAGTRLAFAGGAALVIQGENIPCRGPGEVLARRFPDHPGLAGRFVKAAVQRRGVLAVVELPAPIAAGEAFSVAANL